MKKIIFLTLSLLISSFVISQNELSIYATMALGDAEELKKDVPKEVQILAKRQNEAAVYMSKNAAHLLHDRVLVHGPGYIFKATATDAIDALKKEVKIIDDLKRAFTITEDVLVNQTLNLINTQNIEDHILELEAYGTRYHTRPSSIQAANDLKAKWEAMALAYNRSDVSVRLFNHINTSMPSVIMTITGAQDPEEYVIVGGHLDSTASPSNDNAPGADDDASGIATITEATRALFETGFIPQKTIEVMAYAAEEIGLVGSAEIAQKYSNQNKNVVAVVQFDMTNYNGSAIDVSLISDFTNASLNTYLEQLMDHYNASGAHQFSYGNSLCNYGCSDHASWTNEGFMASFPFEANFGDHNFNIHTDGDTFALSGTATHAAKFAKLCAEFLIETAKSNTILSVEENIANSVEFYIKDNTVYYKSLDEFTNISTLSIYDSAGKLLIKLPKITNGGSMQMNDLPNGVYIATLGIKHNKEISKKFIIK